MSVRKQATRSNPEGYKMAGQYIKEKRQAVGLTQKNVGDALGYEYYTTISHWEIGRVRVPTDLYEELAKVLKQPPEVFVRKMIECNEPHLAKYMWPKTRA